MLWKDNKTYVFEVEVEDFDDLEYCGCEFSTRIKKYGLFHSLEAGIKSVQDKEGPIIKDGRYVALTLRP